MKLIMSDRPLDLAIRQAPELHYIDLSELKISNCTGCFGCWTRTPGKCVIRDDAPRVYPYIAKSEEVVYITKVIYGGYDTIMKTMLERAIPIQQAFIRIHQGETHHIQRNVAPKKATIIAYGSTDPEEQDLFRQLVARNACNMNFASHEVIFTTEEMIDNTVNNILKQWETSSF